MRVWVLAAGALALATGGVVACLAGWLLWLSYAEVLTIEEVKRQHGAAAKQAKSFENGHRRFAVRRLGLAATEIRDAEASSYVDQATLRRIYGLIRSAVS